MSQHGILAGRLFHLLNGLFLAVGNAWIAWCAYVAFVGGALPIPTVDATTQGSVYAGVMFVLFGVPIVSGAAYLAAKALCKPLVLVVSAAGAVARRLR